MCCLVFKNKVYNLLQKSIQIQHLIIRTFKCSVPVQLYLVFTLFAKNLIQDGDNCGLVQWIDAEWPEPMQNALRKIWDMYDQSNTEIERKDKVILKLEEEKKLIQEKHHTHIKETSQFFATVHKNVMRENYEKIMQDSDVEKAVVEAQEEKARLEKENMDLKLALQVIKQSNDELITNWKKAVADQGMAELKQEKKRLEYIIADLLKAGEQNKSKINRIKEICDE